MRTPRRRSGANGIADGSYPAGGNLQVSTRNVNNIAIDPLDENYFASAGSTNDPSVSVWDRRWIAQPTASGLHNTAVLTFSPAVKATFNTSVWSLRYSGLQRGRLGICSSVGEFAVIDMRENAITKITPMEYLPTNPYGGSAWQSNCQVIQTRSVVKPFSQDGAEADAARGSPLIAFDWTSESVPFSGQMALTLYPDRRIDVVHVPVRNPQISITARSALSVGLVDVSLVEPKPYISNSKPGAPYENALGMGAAEDFGPLDYDPEASFTGDPVNKGTQCQLGDPQIGKLLAYSTVQRERCRRGYLWDCHKNMEIVAGNWQLERLWEIIDRFRQQAAGDGMVHKSWDFKFVGVSGLWSERPGNESRRRVFRSPLTVTDALVGLVDDKNIPAFEGERTVFPEHRQICLAVCGWKFTIDDLEEECQELINRGLYYQAIVQAVLHNYKHVALNLLRTLIRSKTVPNTGLGALLASDEINEEQREMCLWMAADTDNPALKALLTFLASGDWRDVMKTNYLHLGYRVALGLKYLNDTELSGFIEAETARAVRNGDLEGILLTGLTEQAMDLFQTYIVKTNDLQTAVLATALTNPLYVDDVRWEMWKEVYFAQMQSWRAFSERAKFSVQHSRMARARDGRILVEVPSRQVMLRCNHCQRSLATRQEPSYGPKKPKVAGPAAHAGTVCPNCGRHMPRCAICMLWLGTPDPSRNVVAKDLAKLKDELAKFLTFCVSCGHGYHADHAKSWFDRHSMCPEPNCQCMCGLE